MASIFEVIKKVQTTIQPGSEESYLLFQKNGPLSGQSVPHVHFHYLPISKENRGSFKLLARTVLAWLRRPLTPDEMHDDLLAFRNALQPQQE